MILGLILNSIWIGIICLSSMLASGTPNSNIPVNQSRKLTAEQAIDRALELTHFNELSHFRRSALPSPTLISINDDETPFLRDNINGRQIWQIQINGIDLYNKSIIDDYKDDTTRTFNILLDPNTGQLMKITSILEGIDSNIAPAPIAKDAETQLRRHGELYVGFVSDSINVNFEKALYACPFNPFSAKEIDAILVMYSKQSGTGMSAPKPVWIINLRGIEPLPTHGPRNAPEVPIYQRNYIRVVLDALSCEPMFSTTIPTVLPKK